MLEYAELTAEAKIHRATANLLLSGVRARCGSSLLDVAPDIHVGQNHVGMVSTAQGCPNQYFESR